MTNNLEPLKVAIRLAVLNDNLKHAEDALLSTDERKHILGVRYLRSVERDITDWIERLTAKEQE